MKINPLGRGQKRQREPWVRQSGRNTKKRRRNKNNIAQYNREESFKREFHPNYPQYTDEGKKLLNVKLEMRDSSLDSKVSPPAPPNSLVSDLNSSGIASDDFRQLNDSLAKRAKVFDETDTSLDTTKDDPDSSKLEISDTSKMDDNRRDDNGNSRSENQLEYTQLSVAPTMDVNVFRDPQTSPEIGLVTAGMINVLARQRESTGQAGQ